MLHKIKLTATRLLRKDTISANAAQIYLIQFFTIISGVISSIIIARVLGPAEKGTINLYTVLSSFINDIGVLGIGSGFLYYLANKNVAIEKVHGSVLAYSFFAGLVTTAVGIVGIAFWRDIFPGLADWIILLPFIIAPITYYLILWSSIMLGIDKAVVSNKIWLFASMITLFATAGLWLCKILNAQTMLWASASISVLNSLVAFVYLFRKTPRLLPDFQLTKNSLAYGSIIFIGTLANLIHFKIDQVMINYWLGPASVGIYALSVTWVEKLFILDNALISAALYKISSSTSSESVGLTNKIFRIQMIVSGSGGLILCAISYPLIHILYGDLYKDAVIPMVLLTPGIVAWSLTKIHSGMLTYNRGLGSFVTKVAVLGSALNVILNLLCLGVLHAGINVVAISSSISYIFVAFITFLKSRKVSNEVSYAK